MTEMIEITAVSNTPFRQKAAGAWADITSGFRDVNFWVRLAYFDLVLRYRRTAFGPWWVVITTALSVGSLGLVFSLVMHQDPRKYLPYLASGIIIWQFISMCITINCETLKANQQTIKNTPTNYTRLILRMIGYHFLVFIHNMSIFVIIAVFLRIDFLVTLPWLIIGLLLLLLNLFWISLLVALLSARFHDVNQVINAAITLLFLITPVFWHKDVLGEYSYLAVFNPLSYMLDVVRLPLLGESPGLENFLVMGGTAIAGTAVTFLFFAAKRRHVPLWL